MPLLRAPVLGMTTLKALPAPTERGPAVRVGIVSILCLQVIKGGDEELKQLMPIKLDDVDLNRAGKPESVIVEEHWVVIVMFSGENTRSPRDETRIVRLASGDRHGSRAEGEG